MTTGLPLHVFNSNGGKMEWGVLEAALQATYSVMALHEWGAAMVTIFDGNREVGMGFIGVRRPGR